MRYDTSSALRSAIEARLRNQSGEMQVRRRKAMAFERILARLQNDPSVDWFVKGGFALDLRFGAHARSTKDLDLLAIGTEAMAIDTLLTLGTIEVDDFFTFDARIKKQPGETQPANTASLHVAVHLDGRRFESINLDLEIVEDPPPDMDVFEMQSLLDFAEIATTQVALISLEQHLAEKLHAYVRKFGGARENTRVKDLVDIVLISASAEIDEASLRRAISSTFSTRNERSFPARLPDPPASWTSGYRTLAMSIGLDPDINIGIEAAREFIEPIIYGSSSTRKWNPHTRSWLSQSDQIVPLG